MTDPSEKHGHPAGDDRHDGAGDAVSTVPVDSCASPTRSPDGTVGSDRPPDGTVGSDRSKRPRDGLLEKSPLSGGRISRSDHSAGRQEQPALTDGGTEWDEPDDPVECADCGNPIDTREWHPVASYTDAGGDVQIAQFCSHDCRQQWMADSSDPTDETPTDGSSDDSSRCCPSADRQ